MSKVFSVTSDYNKTINPDWPRAKIGQSIMEVYLWAEKNVTGDYRLSTSYIFFENKQDILFYKLKFSG